MALTDLTPEQEYSWTLKRFASDQYTQPKFPPKGLSTIRELHSDLVHKKALELQVRSEEPEGVYNELPWTDISFYVKPITNCTNVELHSQFAESIGDTLKTLNNNNAAGNLQGSMKRCATMLYLILDPDTNAHSDQSIEVFLSRRLETNKVQIGSAGQSISPDETAEIQQWNLDGERELLVKNVVYLGNLLKIFDSREFYTAVTEHMGRLEEEPRSKLKHKMTTLADGLLSLSVYSLDDAQVHQDYSMVETDSEDSNGSAQQSTNPSFVSRLYSYFKSDQ